MQVLHKHFSSILRKIEETKFTPLLSQLLKSVYDESRKMEERAAYSQIKQASQWTTTYVAVAYTLLTGQTVAVPDDTNSAYKTELNRIRTAEGLGSDFLRSDLMEYSQFTPRGNYTSSPELENYFRCVKWLNTAPLFIDEDGGLLSAVLLASIIKQSSSDLATFQTFSSTIQFVVGEEDNLSLTHLVNLLTNDEANEPASFADAAKLTALRKKLEAVDPNKVNPQMASDDGKETQRPTLVFTAGRYTFDAEILSKLVHVLRPDPRRPFPKGLDVFATLGSKEAENILINEFGEAKKWKDYPVVLAKLQNQFGQFVEWNKNIYSKTMEAINSLRTIDKRHPLFMKTPSWERKNLITSLAAWTELKHDMLLYAEQPYAAQAGEGGGPPPPQHIGYVEPNIAFWKKALELLALQERILQERDLLTEGIQGITDELKVIGNFLLTVSEKELRGEPLNAKEFDEISWMGGRIEYLTFKIFDSDHLPEKERLVSVVADVYRNNGTYLEEATGLADELYVVVEINGKPYLTRGTVFSYYEFNSGQPLTDEQWQKQLLEGKAPTRPSWTNEITVRTNSLEAKEAYSLLGAGMYY